MHEIRPGVSVDDVKFSFGPERLLMLGYVENVAAFNEELGWKTFNKSDEVDFYVKDHSIICVACLERCKIDGFSLIGKNPDEIAAALGRPNEVGEACWVSDDRQQTPYEYDALGLQIWFEYNKVVSVFCSAIG